MEEKKLVLDKIGGLLCVNYVEIELISEIVYTCKPFPEGTFLSTWILILHVSKKNIDRGSNCLSDKQVKRLVFSSKFLNRALELLDLTLMFKLCHTCEKDFCIMSVTRIGLHGSPG